MRFKTLKFRRKKDFLYVLIMGVVLLLPLVLSITFGKYQTRESIKLAEGNISYKPYDFKIMALYKETNNGEYEEIETMPTGSYIINEEKSYCTLDNINKDSNVVLKTNKNGEHTISNLSKNDKCYLYFDISRTKDIILDNMTTITIRSNFNALTTSTTGTMYTAEDDDGTSYYFAGNPTDNWVKFAGFYWRIIRINGDGTIRMIYQGTTANTTGAGTQIGTSSFNLSYDNNAYVGYMYTLGAVHGTGTSSTIKGVLDTWYANNLINYEGDIDINAGFCGDRQPSTSNSSSNVLGGTGTTFTYYGGYIRFLTGGTWQSNPSPTYKCQNRSDLYTTSSSNKGNMSLSYPIGLITIDEVAYAGGNGATSNSIYFLYTGKYYWTISPCSFDSDLKRAYMFYVHENGYFNRGNGDDGVYWTTPGIRPVINLKSDITFSSGNGTIDNPYVVN